MKNAEMKQIAAEMIAAANINENIVIRVLESTGNQIVLKTTVRYPVNRSYNITKGDVTRTVTDTHYEYCQRGFGLTLWGIQGEKKIRGNIADYIREVC